jgi:hypothetical protein
VAADERRLSTVLQVDCRDRGMEACSQEEQTMPILFATFVLICVPGSAAQAVTRWATPFLYIGAGDAIRCVVTKCSASLPGW